MNKKNLGYRLGKLVRKFRQWQHPAVLKWLYVLVPIAVVFIFSNFFVWVLVIAFGVMLANVSPYVEQTEQKYYHTLCTSEDDSLEVTPAGYYLDGCKLNDEE